MRASASKATPTPVYFTHLQANAVLKRQLVGGTGDAVDGLGFDNGQYNPDLQGDNSDVGGSAMTEAGEIYSSMDTNSMASEQQSATSVSTPLASSSLAGTLSSMAAPTKDTKLASSEGQDNSGLHFHITYLIPVFVLVGLLLLFAVGGKIWGRISYSKERALRRRTRQERLLVREQRREKREKAERIRQQWELNGWGESMSPDVSFEKQHESESEMDESEDELKGPLSAIGTHLAGVKKGRPLPPARRIEQGRYNAKVAANNWWEVQWNRNFGQDDQRGEYSEPVARQHTTPSDNPTTLRATLRGTWERVKLRITENIGWGYDGSTPDFSQRREIVAAAASGNNLWTQVPVESNELPHTRSGLLLPPQLGEDGYASVPVPYRAGRPKKPLFPLTGRQRVGSYSPPELRAPPNTIMAVHPSSSRNSGLASVKDIFTAFRGKSSQSLADAARRGRHERLQSEVLDETSYVRHTHADGGRCALDEPQHLAPMPCRASLDENPFVSQATTVLAAPDAISRSTSKVSPSVRRMPSDMQVSGQLFRARSASSRKREESEEDKRGWEPTSIMRNKSKTSLAVSRSSTVRFTDTVDSSAASFILNYPSTQTPRTGEVSELGQDDDDDDDDDDRVQVSPTRRLSRAKTSAMHRDAGGKADGMRRHKSDGASLDRLDRTASTKASGLKRAPSQIYTEAVKFGDDGEEASVDSGAFLPTVDSRLLPRTKTLKAGLSRLAAREPGKEVVVMDLTRDELAVPALSSASSTESEETGSEHDVESEIDSALLSLIARSNSSKSFFHPFPPLDSPDKQTIDRTPTIRTPLGTPLGRKKTWQERNGKWERTADDEVQTTPGRQGGASVPLSPPPLPLPPAALLHSSPARSAALPASLAVASRNVPSVLNRDSPHHSGNFRRGRSDLFIDAPVLQTTVKSRSLSPAKTSSLLSPSDYGDEEEVEVEERSEAGGAPSTISVHSTHSQYSSASSQSAGTSSSPQRRTAIAKRAKVPRRYQAKLGGGDDDEAGNDAEGRHGRLHTGKSLRTPGERDREGQFAMDRVQSIVTKGHARRQQST